MSDYQQEIRNAIFKRENENEAIFNIAIEVEKIVREQADKEIITKILLPIEIALTEWLEGQYIKTMLQGDTRERYYGFHEGIRLSRAHVIQAIKKLSPQEEEIVEEEAWA